MEADATQLLEAASLNFVEHVSWVARRTRGMRVAATRDLIIVDSGLANDTFNVVCHARIANERLDARVQAVVAYFAKEKRPFAWWLAPTDEPAELEQALEQAGLVPGDSEEILAVDLDDVAAGDRLPEGFQIVHAKGAEHIVNFARTLGRLYDPPERTIPRFYQETTPALYDPRCPSRLYVGYLETETPGEMTAAATGELTLAGGIGGIYNISTLESERGRGLGSAVTVHALLDAKERGLKQCILHAAADKVGFYERSGFRRIGTIRTYQPGEKPGS